MIRKKRIFGLMILLGVFLLLCGQLLAEEDEFSVDEHTLFLVHFNKGLKADFAKGDPNPVGNASITSGGKGRFKEAVVLSKVPNPFSVMPISSIQYKTKDNFPVGEEGTIEFYFYLLNSLDFTGYGRVNLFSMVGEEGDSKAMYIFFDRSNDKDKPPSPLYFWVNNLPESQTSCAFSMERIKKETWYHLAVSWNKAEVRLFLNGELLGRAKKIPFPPLASTMEFGGWYFQGLIDEIRISDICRY